MKPKPRFYRLPRLCGPRYPGIKIYRREEHFPGRLILSVSSPGLTRSRACPTSALTKMIEIGSIRFRLAIQQPLRFEKPFKAVGYWIPRLKRGMTAKGLM